MLSSPCSVPWRSDVGAVGLAAQRALDVMPVDSSVELPAHGQVRARPAEGTVDAQSRWPHRRRRCEVLVGAGRSGPTWPARRWSGLAAANAPPIAAS